MGILDTPPVSRAALANDVGDPATVIGRAMAVDFTPIVPPAALTAPYQAIYSDVPIVVLRTDDTWDIDSTVAAYAANLGLVMTAATNNNFIGLNADRLTLAKLLTMQEAGHEITAHSRTHGTNPATEAEYVDEVVTAADDLRALGFQIQCFTQPGTWTSGGGGVTSPYWMDRFDKLDTYEGKILRKNFAASQGYILDGPYEGMRDLPTPSLYGASHITWETGGLAAVQTQVEQAIARGGNLEILTHLWTLNRDGWSQGKPGNNTIQDYYDFLDWLAVQRNAGRLRVMTPTAAVYAKPGIPRNLLSDPGFELFDTAPANTLWTRAGTALAAGPARTGSAGTKSVQVATGFPIKQNFAAGQTLRSVEISGWVRAVSGSSVGRIMSFLYSSPTGAYIKTLSKTWNVTEAWQHVRFNIGVAPNVMKLDFQFTAGNGATNVYWDDVAVTRT